MDDLIDQHKVLDYCAFEDSSISCYDLSGIQLVFPGEIAEPHEYHPGYISHCVDIYDHEVFEPYISPLCPRDYNNNRPKRSYADISTVWWRHFVPYDSQLAAVGSCKIDIRVIWPASDAHPFEINFTDRDSFESACFDIANEKELDPKAFLYPKKFDELIHHNIKNRHWVQANHGSYSVHRHYTFYTALTKDHLLKLVFRPHGYWDQGTEPPPETLKKVFVSFWDFMDKLTIIEERAQQTRQPGIELKGEALERHRFEQEQARKRSERKLESALGDSLDGW
ncbi:hypothetical protein [Microbulbifer sp.]|uniref:hypothetical protein n=1 Tax=Microbulbifer sp. TaxID=1908541 RepID=UPI00258D950B|nr:hypothetical protein [Microbulbifer sp.]